MKTPTVILAAVLATAALAGCNRPEGSGPAPSTAMNTTTNAPPAGSVLSAAPATTPAPDPAAANNGIDTPRDSANLPAQTPPDTANAPGSPPNPQSPVQAPDQPQVNNPRDAKNYAD